MAVTLTRPVDADEAAARRAGGWWADRLAPELVSLAVGGGRPALVDRDGTTTYTELAATVEDLAAALHGHGVSAGDAVVVVTDNDRHSVGACHAVWRLGAVAVLVHANSGASDIAFACTAVGAAAVLTAARADDHRVALADRAPLVAGIADLAGTSAEPAPAVTVDPDAPRLIVFTSGTTASPKGVVHTANTLRASAANFAAMTDIRSDERFFLVSPLASMAGILQVLQLAPALGAVAVLEHAWDDEATLDLLLASGGTFYGGTDHALERLFAAARRRHRGVPLRTVAVGGAMLRRDVLDDAEDAFGIRVLRVYGSSEAPNSTSAHPDEERDVRLGDDGRPAPGVEVRLDDAGELLVRGPHLFRGYLDPTDNEGAFDGDWFRTGDTASLDAGRVRVVGRLAETANRNGKKLALAEVDEAFRTATGLECAAFAVPDPATGEHVALALVLAEGDELDLDGAVAAVRAQGLATWKLPEVVVRYDEPFPRTATGKVRRRELDEGRGTVLWRAERLVRGR